MINDCLKYCAEKEREIEKRQSKEIDRRKRQLEEEIR